MCKGGGGVKEQSDHHEDSLLFRILRQLSKAKSINFSMKVSLIEQREVTVPEPLVHFSWPQ